ncbi:MAG: hypothetical protein QF605_05595, partial [Rhodospirillales bacterium]|nr:hypothetical protein [Rhodospirillales bacterium]
REGGVPKIIVIISAFIILLFGWQGSVLAVSAKIMSRDCKRLVSYQSSAEYKPGVYVRGRKVRIAGFIRTASQ